MSHDTPTDVGDRYYKTLHNYRRTLKLREKVRPTKASTMASIGYIISCLRPTLSNRGTWGRGEVTWFIYGGWVIKGAWLADKGVWLISGGMCLIRVKGYGCRVMGVWLYIKGAWLANVWVWLIIEWVCLLNGGVGFIQHWNELNGNCLLCGTVCVWDTSKGCYIMIKKAPVPGLKVNQSMTNGNKHCYHEHRTSCQDNVLDVIRGYSSRCEYTDRVEEHLVWP